MTREEYDLKRKKLTEDFEAAKSALAREYAFANNSIKSGDIVTDHIGSILIEEIKFTKGYSNEYPQCVYSGKILKKDLTPTKKGEKRDVYQSNLITKQVEQ
jgi:hypothetical protein